MIKDRMFKLLGDTVKEPELKLLVGTLLEENWHRLGDLPATLGDHHCYIGGLAEHTLNVARNVAGLTAASVHTNAREAELAMAGAFLHDIGKTRAMSAGLCNDGPAIWTEAGKLLDHTTLGIEMITRAAERLMDVIWELASLDGAMILKLQHIIASHHGSPVEPKTPEAVIVYTANMMDGQMARLGRR